MAGARLLFHPGAIAGSRAARERYEARSRMASEAFLEELDAAVERILEAPRRWPRYLAGTRRFLLRRFPFLVVCREIPGGVEVLAVAHAHRKPGYWRAR